MRIVEELNDQQIGSYEIHSEVLSLGFAGGRYKMTPERIAINVKDGEADNSGNKPIDSRFIAHFAFESKIFVGEILHKIHSCTTLIDHRVGLQLAGL
ncbi:hypothetical protein AB1K89_01940 [Sporosarcina sp. 179-K 8C2 HS]|uniref:pyroglutamyl-peptidase I family protein n=1 Tax=Sporosarcina sp. 179-K 8C2 HS TaxID=3142387 RepID=UPI0039A37093